MRIIVALWLLIPAAASPRMAPAQGGEPSRRPALRVETGTHTAKITHLGVDQSGHHVVTVSLDKTARVWELPSGRLESVLRVPIGEGSEGSLYAAAISPDGNTIAVGGWTGFEWEQQNCVYVFDRATGQMLRRLKGLPEVINHLTFSPDGARLAAMLGGANGLRVWRTSDWGEAGRDNAYGDASFGADFDHNGRMITSSEDGYLRLYDTSLRLLLRRETTGGKKPYSVRFSPDASKIAVGYTDKPSIDIVSADDLAPLYRPDTSGMPEWGIMSTVAWSLSGEWLYAGGSFAAGKLLAPVRRWDDGGRGRYADALVARDTVIEVSPLPGGGVAYCAADSSWGVLDEDHKPAHVQLGLTPSYQFMRDNFRINQAGSVVHFALEPLGGSPTVFRLNERALLTDPARDESLLPPRQNAPGISATGLLDAAVPRLKSKTLELEKYEKAISLAVAPDARRFLLGTSFYVRLYDRSGAELWRTKVADRVKSVNISGDGRIAVAACSDGVLRWYNMADGRELLALFPQADGKRWIAWTPAGYYDASPGGDGLVGWQLNNGPDQPATFTPFALSRAARYRPDVIANALRTGESKRRTMGSAK